jgi:hypothetical protein
MDLGKCLHREDGWIGDLRIAQKALYETAVSASELVYGSKLFWSTFCEDTVRWPHKEFRIATSKEDLTFAKLLDDPPPPEKCPPPKPFPAYVTAAEATPRSRIPTGRNMLRGACHVDGRSSRRFA